jgi:hypothetical protein
MEDWKVRELIDEERKRNGPGVGGAIMILIVFGFAIWGANEFGKQFNGLKDRVQQLETKVEQLEKSK